MPRHRRFFHAFVAFLRFDAKRGNRARHQAVNADFLAGFLTVAVCAVFYAVKRLVDFYNQLAGAVFGAQVNRLVGFQRGAVDVVRLVQAALTEVFQSSAGLVE